MPVADWQFIVVTLIAAGGLWTLLRRFAPARQSRGAQGRARRPCSPFETDRLRALRLQSVV